MRINELREFLYGSALGARGFEHALLAVLSGGPPHPDGNRLFFDDGCEIAQRLGNGHAETGAAVMELDAEHGADPVVPPSQPFEVLSHEFHGSIVADSARE